MRILISLVALLLATRGLIAEEDGQVRQRIVHRDLAALEKRAQKIGQLSDRAAIACNKAHSEIQLAQANLDSFSQAISIVETRIAAFKEKLASAQDEARQGYQWKNDYRQKVAQLVQSRMRATQIASQLCDERSQEEGLYDQIIAAQSDAQAAYQAIQSIQNQVDRLLVDLEKLQTEIAEINVLIDNARTAQLSIEQRLHVIQMQRAMAGDDLSEVFELVESSASIYDAARLIVEEHPDEFAPDMGAQIQSAMARVKSEGEMHANCLDEVQESFMAFSKAYEKEENRIAEASRKNRRFTEVLTSVPGSIQGVRELRDEIASQSQSVKAALDEIDLNVRRAEQCRTVDWEIDFTELLEVLDTDAKPPSPGTR